LCRPARMNGRSKRLNATLWPNAQSWKNMFQVFSYNANEISFFLCAVRGMGQSNNPKKKRKKGHNVICM
jgi:hypothetical protein